MTIRIINKSKNSLPAYETAHAAGMDLRADIEEQVQLKPMERKLIPTGLFIELPEGFEAQIRSRSGLAFKHGIGIVNSPGTIDADYRGEIKVLLINFSTEVFEINNGDRIAQMVVARHETVSWNEVEVLNETTRGEGGFGHTAVK
ncbi:deoxyuridine 5'-triphosphate nucleotidohydrolase [Mucilaginibacter lappiensis]|uniref:Deoxyuridine 5'-triphosphate nucleotidohydrolase n=1 Tax=Mucilaginibacter lappiensis TaxID=354630 RepID=A0ABR6PP45_9SPHI|nr:dUTP diphosphatase [Mucilaginibacter lappiensis]MBB6111358.1 dUTP pyrophosphatase [Mucilaginibacter lappiensis]SIR76140.1 deoxyuridine 5'-triphosphate nucleotidohydrolase [Mucilaginibacter lappiensis]